MAARIIIDPHARERMEERGVSEERVKETVAKGEEMPAKLGRVRFVSNFPFDAAFAGVHYNMQQIHAIVIKGSMEQRVITVIVKYF